MWAKLKALALCVAVSTASVQSAAAACGCGPDYCLDDPKIASALATKKKKMAQSYPPRLVALLDKGPQCIARIRMEPDIFSLLLIGADDTKTTFEWSQDNEDVARKQLSSGELKRYWIINSRRAFKCGGEADYDKMPDCDATDDVNASRAIKCLKGSAC